jgi:hypothetical protein
LMPQERRRILLPQPLGLLSISSPPCAHPRRRSTVDPILRRVVPRPPRQSARNPPSASAAHSIPQTAGCKRTPHEALVGAPYQEGVRSRPFKLPPLWASAEDNKPHRQLGCHRKNPAPPEALGSTGTPASASKNSSL